MSCLLCHELLSPAATVAHAQELFVPAVAIAHAQELLVLAAAIAHAQNESRQTIADHQSMHGRKGLDGETIQ